MALGPRSLCHEKLKYQECRQLGQGLQSRLSAVETDLKSLHHVSVCPDAPTTKSSLWTRKGAKEVRARLPTTAWAGSLSGTHELPQDL